jgi:predicted transcriptional regulator of viral defense system
MTQSAQILQLAQHSGFVRTRDVTDRGIPRAVLHRLVHAGHLERIGRGVYAAVDVEPSAYRTFAEVGILVPNGVICLLSALRFHGLTTQAPHEVWMAINVKAWKPLVPTMPIRFVRFSGAALHQGIEHHQIEGVDVKIYTPAKTVADCFKYRNKIGIDVAIEALRETLRARKATVDQIDRFATVCRVKKIIRPYMETMMS